MTWAKENPGDFHFQWECLKVIFLLFGGSSDQPGSLAQLRDTVKRRTVTSDAKVFQQGDEFVQNALDAHLIASLLDFLKLDDESHTLPPDELPLTETRINQLVNQFVDTVIAVPTDEQQPEADHVYNFHRSFVHAALFYHDLRDVIKYEDGPGIIRQWRMWLLLFLASRRRNYSVEAANLLANLKADFSKWMAHIATYNRTINSTGIPGHGKPIDQAVEHHNLIIKNALRLSGSNITEHHLKVVSLSAQMLQDCAELYDEQVQSPFRSKRRTRTEVLQDIKQMVLTLRENRVTCKIPHESSKTTKTSTFQLAWDMQKLCRSNGGGSFYKGLKWSWTRIPTCKNCMLRLRHQMNFLSPNRPFSLPLYDIYAHLWLKVSFTHLLVVNKQCICNCQFKEHINFAELYSV